MDYPKDYQEYLIKQLRVPASRCVNTPINES